LEEGSLSVGFVFLAQRTIKSMLRPIEPDVCQARWFSRVEVEDLLKKKEGLYKPAFNRRTIEDWLRHKRYPLDLLDESP